MWPTRGLALDGAVTPSRLRGRDRPDRPTGQAPGTDAGRERTSSRTRTTVTDDLELAGELVRQAGRLADRMLRQGLDTHHKTLGVRRRLRRRPRRRGADRAGAAGGPARRRAGRRGGRRPGRRPRPHLVHRPGGRHLQLPVRAAVLVFGARAGRARSGRRRRAGARRGLPPGRRRAVAGRAGPPDQLQRGAGRAAGRHPAVPAVAGQLPAPGDAARRRRPGAAAGRAARRGDGPDARLGLAGTGGGGRRPAGPLGAAGHPGLGLAARCRAGARRRRRRPRCWSTAGTAGTWRATGRPSPRPARYCSADRPERRFGRAGRGPGSEATALSPAASSPSPGFPPASWASRLCRCACRAVTRASRLAASRARCLRSRM